MIGRVSQRPRHLAQRSTTRQAIWPTMGHGHQWAAPPPRDPEDSAYRSAAPRVKKLVYMVEPVFLQRPFPGSNSLGHSGPAGLRIQPDSNSRDCTVWLPDFRPRAGWFLPGIHGPWSIRPVLLCSSMTEKVVIGGRQWQLAAIGGPWPSAMSHGC